MDSGLRFKSKALKLVEANADENHSDLGVEKNFVSKTEKTLIPKEVIGEVGSIEIKNICLSQTPL